ncbi:sulfurtransferase complex subunit TusC [Aggregatibacter actinomycetemcomitans]|uniref:Sulfur relay protein TusC/DsrF n=1 Tax=Aggregatibacter actinomycetemcomitans TaxID=714 RepID=A0A5D0EME6_AGGAC|nr:sulfurtransferase complex subunit TusC [Aggregatibacter actinomycetemcomitans]AFI86985.1 sulfur relay protein TusC [Aggregatibacter actinomycetemcomitans D7S-1]KYK92517.1 sulfur relay protein TusC [Aggregatibacter actinomycetemcomitans serotype d str. SA3733]AMQ94107.1 sulfur relay protein TusC/DsrF [Aggregatibacter actinomycetemcomitans]ANU81647.1 tRNA 2-thiouridine(34) synthase TusC [Aggregatibacter actinomycetemcomitans]EKX95741.1 sulfur relay protein TusC/DsrF [Aggregatibacter actinomyc
MIKLAFIFRHAPYGTANTREGLDALLAATVFCAEEDIAVFFLDDGVLNLQKHQQAEQILQKDTASALKLLDLYDIEQRYVCADSLQQFQLKPPDLSLDCEALPREQLMRILQQCEKILTF